MLNGLTLRAMPGHGLSPRELGVLLLHAEVASNSEIERIANITSSERSEHEMRLRSKLGARTLPQAVAKAFCLGLLASRTLCLLAALLTATDGNYTASRTPPRSAGRPMVSLVRVAPSSRNLLA